MKKLALWSMMFLLALNVPVMSVSAHSFSGSCEEEQQVLRAEKAAGNEAEQVRAFVERMYTIVLGRTAEADGLSYWTKCLLEHNIDGLCFYRLYLR